MMNRLSTYLDRKLNLTGPIFGLLYRLTTRQKKFFDFVTNRMHRGLQNDSRSSHTSG